MADARLTAHPHFVMEVDGEIREWSAADTARVEAALARLDVERQAARSHAHVMWLTTTADDV